VRQDEPVQSQHIACEPVSHLLVAVGVFFCEGMNQSDVGTQHPEKVYLAAGAPSQRGWRGWG